MKRVLILTVLLFMSATASTQVKSLSSRGGTVSAPLTLTGSSDAVQLKIIGNATQTNYPLLVEQSGGTDIFTVNNSGVAEAITLKAGLISVTGNVMQRGGNHLITMNNASASLPAFDFEEAGGLGAAFFTGVARIKGTATDIPTLLLKAASSQTADIQRWQDSDNNTLAYVSATGVIKPRGQTSDPCGTTEFRGGGLWYNSTSNYYCFCDGSHADKKVADEATDCF